MSALISISAKRYARALFSLAREREALDAIRDDLLRLDRLLSTSHEFSHFIHHPLIPADQRKAVLDELLRDRAHEITQRFMDLLVAKRRLALLRDIVQAFDALYREQRGILRVRITSAAPLEDRQVAGIRDKLKKRFEKEIEPETAENSALIGGFLVRVGDAVHDYSIRSRLQSFKRKLINA